MDRIKGFCDAVCTPESTSFGPDKGVLRWFGGAWVCPKTNQFRTGERSQMPRLLLHESPFAPLPLQAIPLRPAGNPPAPCRQCQETNGLPCWLLDPKIIPEQHCL